MLTIPTLLALLALAQPEIASAPERAAPPSQDNVLVDGSEYTRAPERWEFSYDIAISPYIEDYRRCLDHTNLTLAGRIDIEAQHRADLATCADVRTDAIEASNAAMTRRGRADRFTPADVQRAFEVIGFIHVERGRNIDRQFALQRRAAEERRRRYAEQIAARDAATARAQAATGEHGLLDLSPQSMESRNVDY